MRFFFYGSLLDPDIRRAVMGATAARCRVVPATLQGWRRRRRKDAIYPVLQRRPGASVAGCVVDCVDPSAAARLTAFEGRSYLVATVQARCGDGSVVPAYVFLPSRPIASPVAWDPDEWFRGRKHRALRKAHAAMAWRGRLAVGQSLRPWQRRQRLA
jgi:Gamma-glutamyl cyclotransferase, AIG2-like